MTYDQAEWHYARSFPDDLPIENGGTHIGMFLAWAIINGLEGDFHKEESVPALQAVRNRDMTGRGFLFSQCDGKFWDEDLSVEGNEFTRVYYDEENYLADYARVFRNAKTFYHVDDTWQNYDRIAPLIQQGYERFKAGNSSPGGGPGR